MNLFSDHEKLVEIAMKSIQEYGKPPKTSAKAIALSITNIVMNSFVSYRNLLKTRGDPPRGAFTGGRAPNDRTIR